MENIEKYGVELTADTKNLTKGLNKATETAKQFSDQMEKLKQNVNQPIQTPIDSGHLKEKVKEYETSLKHIQQKINEFRQKATKEYDDYTGITVVSDNLTDKEREYVQKLDRTLSTIERRKERIKKILGEQFINYDVTQEDIDKLNSQALARYNQGKPITIPIKIDYDETKLNLLKAEIKELEGEYVQLKKDGMTENDASVLKTLLQIQRKRQEYEKLKNAVQEVNEEEEKSGNISIISAHKMNFNFDGLIRNVKRFALSLFGIHSIWRMISRASSSVLSTNEYLTSKLAITWNGLGQMLMPIIEKLINGFQYVAIFIAKVIQLLTGFNGLAKTTTKNINSAGQAAKNLTKSLGGFDELTNLDSSSGTGLASGLASDLRALEEFQEKIKKVEEWMNKTGLTKFFTELREVLKKLWEDTLKPLWDDVVFPALKWLVEHPDVLTTAFGIFLTGKLATGIANVLGVSGTNGVGGSGLAGILGVITAIGTTWYVGYKIGEDIAELGDETVEIIGNNRRAQKNWLQNEEDIQKIIDTNNVNRKNTGKILSGQQRTLRNILGLDDEDEVLVRKNVANMQDQLDKAVELYNQGKLTKEQEQQLVDELRNQYNYNVDISSELEKQGKQTGNIEEFNDRISSQIDAIQNGTKWTTEHTGRWKSEIQKVYDGWKETVEKCKDTKTWMQRIAETKLGSKNVDINVNANTTGAESSMGGFVSRLRNNIQSAFDNIRLDKIANGLTNMLSKLGFSTNKIRSALGLNSFDVGTNYVPNDQLAFIHKGEAIIPKQFNSKEYFGSVGNDDVISAIRSLEQTLREKDMNAYIAEKDVGRASVNYINSQNRLIGRSVV